MHLKYTSKSKLPSPKSSCSKRDINLQVPMRKVINLNDVIV